MKGRIRNSPKAKTCKVLPRGGPIPDPVLRGTPVRTRIETVSEQGRRERPGASMRKNEREREREREREKEKEKESGNTIVQQGCF